MTLRVYESTVEEAALAWLESLGCAVEHGPDISPSKPQAEGESCREMVLKQCLRDALLSKLISGEIRMEDVGVVF